MVNAFRYLNQCFSMRAILPPRRRYRNIPEGLLVLVNCGLKASWWKWKRQVIKLAENFQHSENWDHGIWSHHFMANRWGNNRNRDFIFLGSKITTDSDCSHEIKRCLLLERKAMTNLDSTLKNRDITLPTKVHLVKAMVFPVVMYRCESWT